MLYLNENKIEIGHFPDGSINMHVPTKFLRDDTAINSMNHITWYYEPGEEMALMYLTRHLQVNSLCDYIVLELPYIPNARQDRVKNDEDVFTLKYFCEFINSFNYSTVVVNDAHSNVALGLINNVKEIGIGTSLEYLIQTLKLDNTYDRLFMPDEGAHKRYSSLVKFPSIFGFKNRNWETGKIESLDIIGDVPTRPFDVLIVDDISSYGGTFYHSARKLKQAGADKIYLYITHCENTILKGDLIDSGLVDHIYTTDSIFTESHPLITVL